MTTDTYADALRSTEIQLGWRDFLTLTKPTITMLVVVTSIPGVWMAASSLDGLLIATMVVMAGSGLASASAAVFNQLVERDVDGVMNRTRTRSLPTGKVSGRAAAVFGLVLGIAGFALLYVAATPLAAWVALAGHLFYVVFYTMYLKRRTVQNIVIGGAAGAVGPLIGWAAVSGTIGWPAWLMFLIIFLWTPPHFWSLALKYKDDYGRAGIPMYPTIHGDERTRWWIASYSIALLPCVLALYWVGDLGLGFLVGGLLLTIKFVADAVRLYQSHSNDRAMALFHYSCIYTLVLFALIAIERLINFLT